MKKAQTSFSGEITIIGDFNVNYNLRHTLPFKQLKDFERKSNLTQLINTSTRFRKKCKSCIDLIFTNMDHIISSGVLDISISDHLSVFLIKKKSENPTRSVPTKARSYVNYDKATFQENIKFHPKWEFFWQIEENEIF